MAGSTEGGTRLTTWYEAGIYPGPASREIYTAEAEAEDAGWLSIVACPVRELLKVSIWCTRSHANRKLPYKMSQTRKRHVRERLKNVEDTLNLLNNLGLQMKALVCSVRLGHILV